MRISDDTAMVGVSYTLRWEKIRRKGMVDVMVAAA
jgi:hypothetical protein